MKTEIYWRNLIVTSIGIISFSNFVIVPLFSGMFFMGFIAAFAWGYFGTKYVHDNIWPLWRFYKE